MLDREVAQVLIWGFGVRLRDVLQRRLRSWNDPTVDSARVPVPSVRGLRAPDPPSIRPPRPPPGTGASVAIERPERSGQVSALAPTEARAGHRKPQKSHFGEAGGASVGATGFEPVTPAVSRQCSAAELSARTRWVVASAGGTRPRRRIRIARRSTRTQNRDRNTTEYPADSVGGRPRSSTASPGKRADAPDRTPVARPLSQATPPPEPRSRIGARKEATNEWTLRNHLDGRRHPAHHRPPHLHLLVPLHDSGAMEARGRPRLRPPLEWSFARLGRTPGR